MHCLPINELIDIAKNTRENHGARQDKNKQRENNGAAIMA